jgi:DNA-binding protein HU-beta
MTKVEFVKEIANNTLRFNEGGNVVERKITVKQAEDIYNMIFGEEGAILAGLKMDGEVKLAGFGKFTVAEREARQGRNPQTGEAIQIEATKNVRFKAASALKDEIQ